ncbi:MAG: hypothetical protein HQL25_03100 [Candidatus Omnitrophica bacterium]|nr:hypothetical protein [Candidatus Omnitrophota bacterium]
MKKILLIGLCVFAAGCSFVQESGRKVWGTSTEHLSPAHLKALSKVYTCNYDDCYDTVLTLTQVAQELKLDVKSNNPLLKDKSDPNKKVYGPYSVFIDDRLRGIIVFMDVPGQVDTTEVGVFFTKFARTNEIKIQVTSLSTRARDKAAQMIFSLLDKQYTSVK